MIKLYADEDFNNLAVKILREMGYDIKTTQELGKAGQVIPENTPSSLVNFSLVCAIVFKNL